MKPLKYHSELDNIRHEADVKVLLLKYDLNM